MPKIHVTSFINAPVDRVFDLSRSINLHQISMASTNEKAIAGEVTGLINEGESVTWEARHLFKTRRFTSKITAMERPNFFIDDMLNGDFEMFHHEHHFKAAENGTIMIDVIDFKTPFGFLGKFVNIVFLKKYMEKFLARRNSVIREYAETQKWKAILI